MYYEFNKNEPYRVRTQYKKNILIMVISRPIGHYPFTKLREAKWFLDSSQLVDLCNDIIYSTFASFSFVEVLRCKVASLKGLKVIFAYQSIDNSISHLIARHAVTLAKASIHAW